MVRSAILQLTAAGLVALASPCIAIAQLDDPLHPWCGNDSTLWRLPRKPRVPDLSSAKAFTSVKAVMAQFDRGAFANSLPDPGPDYGPPVCGGPIPTSPPQPVPDYGPPVCGGPPSTGPPHAVTYSGSSLPWRRRLRASETSSGITTLPITEFTIWARGPEIGTTGMVVDSPEGLKWIQDHPKEAPFAHRSEDHL